MGSSRVTVSAQNRGPLINIVSWILLVIMCLATLVKVYGKWSTRHTLQYDDIYLTAAMVCSSPKNIFS